MSFERSCFLSYRHRPPREYVEVVSDFYGMLETEILLHLSVGSLMPPRDGDNFITNELAYTLCTSLCMVVLYVPAYFDSDQLSCAREYRAMELLEAQRMMELGHANKHTHGLIIPVIYRGWDDFPERIKQERNCYNIQQYTLGKRVKNNSKVKVEVQKIAEYIGKRYAESKQLDEPCFECREFAYPEEGRVAPWLATLEPPRRQERLPGR
jgi:hypothetical protein